MLEITKDNGINVIDAAIKLTEIAGLLPGKVESSAAKKIPSLPSVSVLRTVTFSYWLESKGDNSGVNKSNESLGPLFSGSCNTSMGLGAHPRLPLRRSSGRIAKLRTPEPDQL
jgi:hypothetical protein